MRVLPEKHHVMHPLPKGVNTKEMASRADAAFQAANNQLERGRHLAAAQAFLNYANNFHDYIQTYDYLNALYMVCVALGEIKTLSPAQLASVAYILRKIQDQYPEKADKEETGRAIEIMIEGHTASGNLTDMILHTSPACAKHDPSQFSEGHPESSKRLTALSEEAKIPFEQFGGVITYDHYSPDAVEASIKRAHGESHCAALSAVLKNIDSNKNLLFMSENNDNILNKGSHEAIYSCVSIADAVMEAALHDEAPQSHYAVIRPPGHHAGDQRVKEDFYGFCFVNNVMISAHEALAQNRNVLIVDIDAHTGNGTANMIENLRDEQKEHIRFIDLYANDPHSFTPLPFGKDLRSKICHNYPLPKNFTGDVYLKHLNAALERIMTEGFKPDVLIISAGFDAHMADTLIGGRLTSQDFGIIGQTLFEFSQKSGIPIVAMTEGGYDLNALKDSSLYFALGIGGRFAPGLWDQPTAASALASVIEAQQNTPEAGPSENTRTRDKGKDPLRTTRKGPGSIK